MSLAKTPDSELERDLARVNMLKTIFRRYAVTNCFEAADIAILVCSNPQYVYIPPWLFIVRSFEQ